MTTYIELTDDQLYTLQAALEQSDNTWVGAPNIKDKFLPLAGYISSLRAIAEDKKEGRAC